jgi:hypothetical protein
MKQPRYRQLLTEKSRTSRHSSRRPHTFVPTFSGVVGLDNAYFFEQHLAMNTWACAREGTISMLSVDVDSAASEVFACIQDGFEFGVNCPSVRRTRVGFTLVEPDTYYSIAVEDDRADMMFPVIAEERHFLSQNKWLIVHAALSSYGGAVPLWCGPGARLHEATANPPKQINELENHDLPPTEP